MQAEEVAFGVVEPRRLLGPQHADMPDGLEAGQVVLLEADARAFNGVLRRIGFKPRRTGRWPANNLAKAYGWRLLRKLRGAR